MSSNSIISGSIYYFILELKSIMKSEHHFINSIAIFRKIILILIENLNTSKYYIIFFFL